MLGLSNSEPIARDNNHFIGSIKDHCCFFRGIRFYNNLFRRIITCCWLLQTHCTKDHIGQGPVHSFAHNIGQNKPGCAHQCARNDKAVIHQDKPGGCGGHTGIRIQQWNDNGHICTANWDCKCNAHDGRNGSNRIKIIHVTWWLNNMMPNKNDRQSHETIKDLMSRKNNRLSADESL